MPSLPLRLPLLALLPAMLFGAQLAPALAQTAPAQPVSTQTAPTTFTFSLQDALAGLTASAQYRQLQLTLATAQAQAQAAQAATGFTAGVGASAGYGSASTQTTAADGTTTTTTAGSFSGTLTASASLPVLPWSTANLSAQSAARNYALAQVTFAQAVAALRASVEQAYGRALTAQLNLSIATNTLTLSQRQLAQVTAFQAQNNATVQAVQTAQAAVQTAQTGVLSAQNELSSARRALGTLVGRDLSGAAFSSDLSAPLAQAALPTGVAALSAAQAFSPALASAQKAVTDAQATLTTAERNRRLPAATVTAQYGPGSSTSRSGLSTSLNLQTGVASASYSQAIGGSGSGTASFALGLNASFNLLDPAADGALKVAQLGLQQAQLAVTVQQTTLAQTLQDAYSAAQVAAGSVAARQTLVTAYTTALTTARARLAVGLSTETDVLNAEIALAQAQRDLSSAQVLALTTAAQLSALTGLSGAP